MRSLEQRLADAPRDGSSRQLVRGALGVVSDAENPIRVALFAAAVREPHGHTLHRMAPDDQVGACSWFAFEKGQTKPTRRQRAKFATQGALPDDLIEEAGVDVERLHDAANKLSKHTHVRPGTIHSGQAEIDAFVRDAFGALIGLFESFDECRNRIQSAVLRFVLGRPGWRVEAGSTTAFPGSGFGPCRPCGTRSWRYGTFQ